MEAGEKGNGASLSEGRDRWAGHGRGMSSTVRIREEEVLQQELLSAPPDLGTGALRSCGKVGSETRVDALDRRVHDAARSVPFTPNGSQSSRRPPSQFR